MMTEFQKKELKNQIEQLIKELVYNETDKVISSLKKVIEELSKSEVPPK